MAAETPRKPKPLSLPREPIPLDLLDEVLPLPQHLLDSLPTTPDHIVEARIECVYEFLEQDLLPKLRIADQLSPAELAQLATHRKIDFRDRHPNDLVGDFQLLDATHSILFQLQIYYDSQVETDEQLSEEAELVTKASSVLSEVFYNNLDDLMHI